eukprot:TRINITY_DN57850_c0_g1_i1.p1 TRINITY_DN57850_c0_g1~~TRINITY_DN57850_c0_g1_i1.p1  ORF type:complete len:181 (+),score=31.85 TRINITY_DN57850_c0_g1_i1:26-568(+)
MGVIPTVTHCFCGCCRLDTGCKILGILGTIAGLVGIAAISIVIYFDGNRSYADKFCEHWLDVPACQGGHAYAVVLGLLVMFLLICLLYTLVSILLVIGARKSNPSLLLPWLVWTAISIISSVVQNVAFFCTQEGTPKFLFMEIGQVLAALFLGCYFWVCVYSHRRELLGSGFGGRGYLST